MHGFALYMQKPRLGPETDARRTSFIDEKLYYPKILSLQPSGTFG